MRNSQKNFTLSNNFFSPPSSLWENENGSRQTNRGSMVNFCRQWDSSDSSVEMIFYSKRGTKMTKIRLCKKNCYSAPFFDEYFERNTFFFFNNTNDNTFYINVKTVQKKKKLRRKI